jgi:RimJ/RimL family protein N-acetyltransferase
MPWTTEEPRPPSDRVALLQRFRGRFDLGEDFVYGIFDRDETRVLGGTGLHTRLGDEALEIGYWIRADCVRQGFVTESTAGLTKVAFEVCGVDRVEIRCDPANGASRGVPLKLGYLEEATLRRRLHHPEPRDAVVYSMFADTYGSSPAASARVEAFDVLGERVL